MPFVVHAVPFQYCKVSAAAVSAPIAANPAPVVLLKSNVTSALALPLTVKTA